MKCPKCKYKLSDREIARHMGAKGGRKAAHSITPAQQAKMQAGRQHKHKGVKK